VKCNDYQEKMGEAMRRKRKQIIVSLLIATFLTAIEGTIVSTAMPSIVEDLGGSQLFTWVISVYLFAGVVATPIFGKLADLYGRKIMFTIGVIIFLVGSILSGLSQTMQQLVLYRLIQGIGAGALTTIPFTIIGDVFPFEQRAKVQGLISSIWGISGIIGPLAGGFIVDTISWHWIFYMNLPFGLISLLLLWASLQEKVERKKTTIDYAGIITFTIGISSFLYGLTLWKEQKQIAMEIISLFLIALVGLCLFLWLEAKGKEPMLPLSLFQIRYILVANLGGFLLGFVLVAVTFYIPLWVQGVTDLNATYSGLAMLPMSITWPLGSMLTGRWIAKASIRQISSIGCIIITLGCIGLTMFEVNTGIQWMMVVTAIIGLGFGITYTSFTVTVQSSVEWNLRGAAMGSHQLMRQLGQTIGIAVSGLLLSDQLKGNQLAESLHQVFILLILLAFVSLLITMTLLRKKDESYRN
jgi:EmrB/QacA subfamily drug resistance transporter